MTIPQPRVDTGGPIFDGRALAAAREFAEAAGEEIAAQGVNDVRAELDAVLQNPTGFYESQIQTDRQRDDTVVTDGGVVYGPWLATGRRRGRQTAFGGYDHWRRATQRLDSKAEEIAEQALPPFLRRMNG